MKCDFLVLTCVMIQCKHFLRWTMARAAKKVVKFGGELSNMIYPYVVTRTCLVASSPS